MMKNKIPLIIPCAGLGYRRSDRSKPKFLERADYYFEEIERCGIISDVMLVVNPVTGGYIQDYVDNRIEPTFPVKYATQELPLGFGHAVYCSAPLVADPVMWEPRPALIMADDRGLPDVHFFLRSAHTFSRSCLNLFKYEGDVSDKGVAYLWGERVVRVVEKPYLFGIYDCIGSMYYVSDAGHLFRALDHFVRHRMKTHGEYQLTDAIQFMIEDGHPFFRMQMVEDEDS